MKSKLLLLSIVAVSLVASFFTVYALKSQQETRSRAAEASPSATQTNGEVTESAEPSYESDVFIVTLKNGRFSPSPAIIKLDTPIVFMNQDNVEIEVAGNGGVQTASLKHTQKSGPFQYKAPGTYTYHLKSNPQVKGTVTVIK